jgi:Xaa-Pro aminopeptidase
VTGDRLDRARALMAERGIDVLLLSVGADLPYLTGYRAMPLERLTMLVLPGEGTATLVVPELEAPRVERRPGSFDVFAWGETADPIALVARLAGPARRVAVGDTTWSAFLMALQERMPAARFEPASPLTRELRMRKDDGEIRLLRAAAEAADRVVDRLASMRFSGRSERDLAREIAAMTVAEGHDEAAFTIVAAGPNAASPHHEPADRVVGEGDTVVVDFGGTVGGYGSDTTRTFSVGSPAPEVAAAHAVLEEAQRTAVEAVRPGVAAEDVDRTARGIIASAGYGDFFVHRTGHGIGLETHEHPYIVEGNGEALEPGMVFSVEPGIYVPGRFGMRIEDIVAVTADGVDPLNRSPHGLCVVG